MRYYKIINENYITAIGTGYGNTEITKSEYDTISSVIQNRPQAEGKGYHLRTDLTWEEYDLPPSPPVEEEATEEDFINALEELGVTNIVNEVDYEEK